LFGLFESCGIHSVINGIDSLADLAQLYILSCFAPDPNFYRSNL